jgi:hypothetical protein
MSVNEAVEVLLSLTATPRQKREAMEVLKRKTMETPNGENQSGE